MLLPQFLIVAVMLSVAFLPQFYLNTIGNMLAGIGKMHGIIVPSGLAVYSESITNINLYSALFLVVILISWTIRSLAVKGKPLEIQPTWGCAYVSPKSSMQYTGKSFSKSLGKIFNFILIEEKKYKELKPGEIFPKNRKYVSHYFDFFEFRLIDFVTHHLAYGANYFKFIQNGRMQSYVWYGIVFMLAIFMLTVFNVLK
jgi:hypothetical protein